MGKSCFRIRWKHSWSSDDDGLLSDEDGHHAVVYPASFFDRIEALPNLRSLKLICEVFAVYDFGNHPKLCSMVSSLGINLGWPSIPQGMRPKEFVVLDFAFGGDPGTPERNQQCANHLMTFDFVETLVFEVKNPAVVLQFGMSPNTVRLELRGRLEPGTEAEAEGAMKVLEKATSLRTVATPTSNTEWLNLFRQLTQTRPEIAIVELEMAER